MKLKTRQQDNSLSWFLLRSGMALAIPCPELGGAKSSGEVQRLLWQCQPQPAPGKSSACCCGLIKRQEAGQNGHFSPITR